MMTVHSKMMYECGLEDIEMLSSVCDQALTVNKVIYQQNWTVDVFDGFDVALLKLSIPMKNVQCPRLALANIRYIPNTIASLLGWGPSHNLRDRSTEAGSRTTLT